MVSPLSSRTRPGSKVTHGIESKNPKTAGHLIEGLTNQRARLDHVTTTKHMHGQLGVGVGASKVKHGQTMWAERVRGKQGPHDRGPRGTLQSQPRQD